MHITGYRILTEKERDYVTIYCLLRKYGMLKDEVPTLTIPRLLDELRGGVPFGVILHPDTLLQFCLADTDSPSYTLVLSKLPENTVELLIETK